MRGFTLLELMLALAVLAIVATAVLGRGADTVRALHGLEERTLARYLAENELARLRLQQRRAAVELRPEPDEEGEAPGRAAASAGKRPALAVGTRRSEQRLGNRVWRIVLDAADTDQPGLQRISVTVYADADRIGAVPVETLVGFVGRS